MKQYLLFYYDSYYPSGGWDDLKGTYDTLEEAREIAKLKLVDGWDWVQVIDITTGSAVFENLERGKFT